MTAKFSEFVENGSYFRWRAASDRIVYDCLICGTTGLSGEQTDNHEASFNHVNNARAFELERAKEILVELVRHANSQEYSATERARALKIVVDDAREFLRSI